MTIMANVALAVLPLERTDEGETACLLGVDLALGVAGLLVRGRRLVVRWGGGCGGLDVRGRSSCALESHGSGRLEWRGEVGLMKSK
jgi:hypothetical protein